MLSAEGMSTRAIAPVVGADQKTVSNDLRKPREEFSSPEQNVPRFDPDPIITGRDGKTYVRSAPVEPSKPKRRPITDQANDAEIVEDEPTVNTEAGARSAPVDQSFRLGSIVNAYLAVRSTLDRHTTSS